MNRLSLCNRVDTLRLLACLLLVCSLGLAPTVWAAGGNCSVSPNQPVILPFPSMIAASGTVGNVGTAAQATISFSCDHFQGNQSPLTFKTTVLPTFTQGAGYLQFDTALADFKLRISATSTGGTVTASGQTVTVGTLVANGQGGTLSVTITGQLYRINSGAPVTLHVGTGSAVTGSFGYYYPSNSSSNADGTFTNTQVKGVNLSVAPSSCSVNSPANFTVTLPNISTTALAGPAGTTAGVTPFNLSYTCPSTGATSIPSMTSPMADATIVGLINPIAGNASNVGLRIMNSSLTAGVDIKGANQPAVVSTGGAQLLPYYVEYYRTSAAAIGAGPVTGAVSYTLTYQ